MMIALHFSQSTTSKLSKTIWSSLKANEITRGYGIFRLQILPPPTSKNRKEVELTNGIICQCQTKVKLAEYLSGSCFGLTKSTLIWAIKNNQLTSWPGMTQELINKHVPKSVVAAKGHLDQESKKLQSTKTKVNPVEHDIAPSQENNNTKTNDIMCSIFETSELNSKSYSDQTGKFPITSFQGNTYIFVMYHYNTNSINMVPIKSRHTQHITQAWLDTFQILKYMVKPLIYIY